MRIRPRDATLGWHEMRAGPAVRPYGAEPVTKPQTTGMAPAGCGVGARQPIR